MKGRRSCWLELPLAMAAQWVIYFCVLCSIWCLLDRRRAVASEGFRSGAGVVALAGTSPGFVFGVRAAAGSSGTSGLLSNDM